VLTRNELAEFRRAAIVWAGGGRDAAAAAETARRLARDRGALTAILVEGVSDRAAIETLAVRLGRDLDAEGVCVIPMGGAMSIGRYLELIGPPGLDIGLAGLCDVGERDYFRRSLERVLDTSTLTPSAMEALGFFVCVADLEDELIRAIGVAGVEGVIDSEGDMRALRTFRNQPAQRERAPERQLRRFMGTLSGRKERYATVLVSNLELARIPRPLEQLLAHR
jgi:hypothetical protein